MSVSSSSMIHLMYVESDDLCACLLCDFHDVEPFADRSGTVMRVDKEVFRTKDGTVSRRTD